jgi:hypothetical protein
VQLGDRQREFANALLDPAAGVPTGVVGPDGLPSGKRFAVYRNNVVVGLIDALQANFPVTCRLVGEDFFRAMAREFVMVEPPRSAILLYYGEEFPDFVGRFAPAEPLPYLSDVARIERAWTESFNSEEAFALDADELAAFPSDRAHALRFELHPSVRVVRSSFPALTIWRMNVAGGVAAPVDLEAGGENALIVRPAAEVEVRSLPSGGAEFIRSLAQGLSLVEAAKFALNASAFFDLASNIEALIGAGALVRFRTGDSPDVRYTEAKP